MGLCAAAGHLGRPCPPACEVQGGPELSVAQTGLEELCLHPGSPLEGSPGPAETQDRPCPQPGSPGPSALEATAEQDSPPEGPSSKVSGTAEAPDHSRTKRSVRLLFGQDLGLSRVGGAEGRERGLGSAGGGLGREQVRGTRPSLPSDSDSSRKKPQGAPPVSKIDQWLEQYTQAVETAARTPKLARQASFELPSVAVATTKTLWETGEVQAQSVARGAPCKDIVAGDMSKKGLWEQQAASTAPSTTKGTPSGKRFKFVATGHGKYEKVPVDVASAP
ncbi:Lymphocyte-specific protein 1 [Galemys pyrenaicus]|uniref:Lymphocyte-specific protein 1 n=1 Tax=Galemys pyrenaicus TaxID=202257 RepID=A0A8J6DMS4_GALPY|nr:Lymphocyte-specific protein 1 [Galemys pyrenaicus]